MQLQKRLPSGPEGALPYCLLSLFGFFDLLDVLRGILLEVLQAALAAEFYLAALVFEDVGCPVVAELLVGDDALLQWIWFRLIGFCIFGFAIRCLG
jgi:hypothetical protein